jgi:hypothetical protein
MNNNDFNTVLHGHGSWLLRLSASVAGTNDEVFAPELIRDHDSCVLGRWIQAHPELYGNPDLHGTVTALHQTIHEIAAEIAEMIAAATSAEIIQTYLDALDLLLRELIAFQLDKKNETLDQTE